MLLLFHFNNNTKVFVSWFCVYARLHGYCHFCLDSYMISCYNRQVWEKVATSPICYTTCMSGVWKEEIATPHPPTQHGYLSSSNSLEFNTVNFRFNLTEHQKARARWKILIMPPLGTGALDFRSVVERCRTRQIVTVSSASGRHHARSYEVTGIEKKLPQQLRA
jgi:hypothetical protein